VLDRKLCAPYTLADSWSSPIHWEEICRALEGILMICATEENGLPGYLKGGVSHVHAPLNSPANPLPGRLSDPLLSTSNHHRQQTSGALRRVTLRGALIPARPFWVHWAEIVVPRSLAFFRTGGESLESLVNKLAGSGSTAIRAQSWHRHSAKPGANSAGSWIHGCKTVNKIDTAYEPLLSSGTTSIILK